MISASGTLLPTTDTLPRRKMWIYTDDALRVKAAADSFKIAKVEIRLLKEDMSNLIVVIADLRVAVAKAQSADSLGQRNLKLALEREQLLRNQILLAEAAAANWERAYRREKRKRVITSIVGILATAAAIIIPNLK